MATPASAYYGPGGVEVYQNSNYSGSMALIGATQGDYTQLRFLNGQTLIDQVSSIKNDTSYGICFFEHTWYGGAALYMPPHSQFNSLWLNDMISSNKPC
jgi:hypothetical protein